MVYYLTIQLFEEFVEVKHIKDVKFASICLHFFKPLETGPVYIFASFDVTT